MMWLLLSSGRGPVECQMAVKGLINIVCEEAKLANIEYDILETEDGPHGFLSALISLEGEGSEILAQSWKGTIRWICQSPIRTEHKRKNWFVGVHLLSPPSQIDAFRESDLVYESMRASGPGGQNVNNVATKIRLTHTPTGISVIAQEERSQYRNKALALAKLKDALAEKTKIVEASAEKTKWSRHDELIRGNEFRTYAGLEFKRKII